MGAGQSRKLDIQEQISSSPIVVFSMTSCHYCVRAKSLLCDQQLRFTSYELNNIAGTIPRKKYDEYLRSLRSYTNSNFVPQIFICGDHIGGYQDLLKLHMADKLLPKVSECMNE